MELGTWLGTVLETPLGTRAWTFRWMHLLMRKSPGPQRTSPENHSANDVEPPLAGTSDLTRMSWMIAVGDTDTSYVCNNVLIESWSTSMGLLFPPQGFRSLLLPHMPQNILVVSICEVVGSTICLHNRICIILVTWWMNPHNAHFRSWSVSVPKFSLFFWWS